MSNEGAPLKIKFNTVSKPVGPGLDIELTPHNTLVTIRVTRDTPQDTNVFTAKLRRSKASKHTLGRMMEEAVAQLYRHVGVTSPDRWPPELWQAVVERHGNTILSRDGWLALPTHGYQSVSMTMKKGKNKGQPPQRVTVAEHGVWAAGVVNDERVKATLNVTITHKASGLALPAYATSIEVAKEVMRRLENAAPGWASDAKMNGDNMMKRQGVADVVAAMQQAINDGLLHTYNQ